MIAKCIWGEVLLEQGFEFGIYPFGDLLVCVKCCPELVDGEVTVRNFNVSYPNFYYSNLLEHPTLGHASLFVRPDIHHLLQ